MFLYLTECVQYTVAAKIQFVILQPLLTVYISFSKRIKSIGTSRGKILK